MLSGKYLLLELDPVEADFYHLPEVVPYFRDEQKNLDEKGFDWEVAVSAMRALVSEADFDEYKPYKLFIKKWDHYKTLSQFIKSKKWHEAEKIIDKILSIDLLDPSAYLNLGFVFRSRGEFSKAKQVYLKGMELIPSNIPFLAGLARTYEELKQDNEAIYYWKQILDLENDNEEALNMLIKHRVYKRIEKRDPSTKRKTFKTVIDENFGILMEKTFEKNYDNLEVLTDLGLTLIQESQTKLAVNVFERVYQLSKEQNKEIPEHLKI